MANVRDGVTRLPKPVVEEIVPNSGWTEDSNGHYLLVDLPGFKKTQVKVQILNSRLIKVNGERPVNENKHIRFEQNFTVPENSDSEGITAKFDGEILYITVPKHKAQEEKKEPEPAGLKDQGVVPKHEAEEKKEPEPTGTKDQAVASKHETKEKKEPEPAGTKDQAVASKHETKEKKEPQPAGTKDQAVASKHETKEKKEPQPAGTKDQAVASKHETKEKKEPQPADMKDQGVNGTTKENKHTKPNDNKTETKDDNGQQVCRSKKKEGIQKNAPMSFSEDTVGRWEGEPSYLRGGMKMLKDNKGVVVTAMLAFALGIIIYQKFKANEE